VDITEYVARARPCPCCGTVTEGSYRDMCGRGPASAGDLRASREPDGWAPNFGPAGNAAAAPVPRHRRLDGIDGRDPREDRRAGVAASGFMERAREPLKTASAMLTSPRTAVGIRPPVPVFRGPHPPLRHPPDLDIFTNNVAERTIRPVKSAAAQLRRLLAQLPRTHRFRHRPVLPVHCRQMGHQQTRRAPQALQRPLMAATRPRALIPP
jgi:hypothetical protein